MQFIAFSIAFTEKWGKSYNKIYHSMYSMSNFMMFPMDLVHIT